MLSLIAIIYGAIVAIVQPDLKKLVAYSSVSHMGFVTLGIFVFQQQGMQGAILQMINHGIITGALFLCVGVIYERTHDRTIAKMGGLAARTPVYAAIFGFFMLASLGLPGLAGFVGEFLVFVGTFAVSPVGGRHRGPGDGLRGGLPAVDVPARRVRRGQRLPARASGHHLTDMTRTEVLTLAPLVALTLVFGIYPAPRARLHPGARRRDPGRPRLRAARPGVAAVTARTSGSAIAPFLIVVRAGHAGRHRRHDLARAARPS